MHHATYLECIFSHAHDFIYLVQSSAEFVSLSQNPRHPAVVSLTPPHLWWPLSDLQQRCLWHHHLNPLPSVWYCLCLSLYYHKHRYHMCDLRYKSGKWVTPVIVYTCIYNYLSNWSGMTKGYFELSSLIETSTESIHQDLAIFVISK